MLSSEHDAVASVSRLAQELERFRDHNRILTQEIDGWKRNVEILREKSRLMEETARASDRALTEWEMSAPQNGPILRALEATTVARKALHRALNANPVGSYKTDLTEARAERDRAIAHTHTLGRQIEVLEHDLADQTQTLSILLTNGDPTLTFDDCFQRVEALQTSVVVLAERVNELEAECSESLRVLDLGREAVRRAFLMKPWIRIEGDAAIAAIDSFENARHAFIDALSAQKRPPAGAESTAGPTEAPPKAARRDPSPPVEQSVDVTDFMPADVAAQVRDGTCEIDVGPFIAKAIAHVAEHERMKPRTQEERWNWSGFSPEKFEALTSLVAKLSDRVWQLENLTMPMRPITAAAIDEALARKRAEPPRPETVVTMAELEGGTGGGTEATTVTGWNESRQRFETPPPLPSAKGERCTMCHADAVLKVEQSDPPQTDSLAGHPVYAHPFTAYVCEPCFRWVMFGEKPSGAFRTTTAAPGERLVPREQP
jgi:hypothetical protein